jgi:hypothetical protein
MNASTLAQLTDRKLLLILGYAPAGLGHLRVTDALYHGLPDTVNPVVLGSGDKAIQSIHRLTSVNPVGKAVFDWLQGGPFRDQTNRLYRNSLRGNHRDTYNEMCRLLDERMERPERILVACTHFGLAHKLAAIKEELQEREGVRMVLSVCVTDDTFQHIWYVDGADLLVVPSVYTQRKYVAYGEETGTKLRVEVAPYPIHPRLGDKLDEAELAEKTRQLAANSAEPIHVSIPISGAAVGTDYLSALMARLRERSERFRFHVVGKDAAFTREFLAGLAGKAWIDVRAPAQDRQVVTQYNVLMQRQTLALEVTKPSEQTFKCLAGTGSRGGVILLLTQPVGTQEFENMNFLRRHSLAPSSEANRQLWAMAAAEERLEPAVQTRLLEESRLWRCVRIPADPQQAAGFIWWMLTTGFFSRMLEGTLDRMITDEDGGLLGPDGVVKFWDLAMSL